MKVLHILLSEAFGGLELYVCNLMLKQSQTGMDIYAYILPNTRVDNYLKKQSNHSIHVFYGDTPKKINLKNIKRVRKIVKQEGIPIIHSHNSLDIWTASIACFWTKTKHIYSVYMSVAHSKKTPVHYYIYKKIKRYISTSQITNTDIEAKFPNAKNKTILIPYGLETDKYNCTQEDINEIQQKYNAENKLVVGFLGRIDIQKGVKEVVDSYTLLPENIQKKVIYWIIGEPTIAKSSSDTIVYEEQSLNLEKYIQSIIQKPEYEKSIVRIGFQEKYISYLGCMDIFILASYKEMYSLSLLEAMLMKVPIIGTNTGGTVEQIQNKKTGILIEPKNAKQIAQSVVELVENPDLRKKYAEEAYKWVKNKHEFNNILPLYKQVYEESINE
jgi:glycosyltransferase involved in cell wall biosynthesis